jgi:hypothetical protein
MAEERALGFARATEQGRDELSKEELQRRMEEARESISHTVTEIKETMAHQVETVKEALDWREHFKKQPLAWSLGAVGVGLLAGYGIAAALKGEDDEVGEYAPATSHAYAAQPIIGESHASVTSGPGSITNGDKDEGLSLLERFRETSAYDRLSKEVSSLGDRLIDELSTTAQLVVLPALLDKIRNWIGIDLSDKRQPRPSERSTQASNSTQTGRSSPYQPVLERPS